MTPSAAPLADGDDVPVTASGAEEAEDSRPNAWAGESAEAEASATPLVEGGAAAVILPAPKEVGPSPLSPLVDGSGAASASRAPCTDGIDMAAMLPMAKAPDPRLSSSAVAALRSRGLPKGTLTMEPRPLAHVPRQQRPLEASQHRKMPLLHSPVQMTRQTRPQSPPPMIPRPSLQNSQQQPQPPPLPRLLTSQSQGVQSSAMFRSGSPNASRTAQPEQVSLMSSQGNAMLPPGAMPGGPAAIRPAASWVGPSLPGSGSVPVLPFAAPGSPRLAVNRSPFMGYGMLHSSGAEGQVLSPPVLRCRSASPPHQGQGQPFWMAGPAPMSPRPLSPRPPGSPGVEAPFACGAPRLVKAPALQSSWHFANRDQRLGAPALRQNSREASALSLEL